MVIQREDSSELFSWRNTRVLVSEVFDPIEVRSKMLILNIFVYLF